MNKKVSVSIVVIILLILGAAAVYSVQKNQKVDFSDERQQAIDQAATRPAITINT